MKRATFLWLMVSGSFLLGVASVHAAEAKKEKKEPPKAVTSLYKKIVTLNSLKASFTQTITDHENNLVQKSKGVLSLRRPHNIYWETLPPYEQIVVGDEKVLWVYDPDLEQATRYNSGEQMKGPMTLLSSSEKDIEQQYNVSVNHDKGAYILVPKADQADSSFAQLAFTFDSATLKRIEIRDKTRQLTVIDLADIQQNAKIPDSQFVFTVPDGVDVLINE